MLRKILSHKLMFESISEPNMVKPPVVYVVGLHRSFGLGIKDQTAYDFLDADGPAAVQPAERVRLGGRPVVAEHQHGAVALRARRRAARPEGPEGQARRDRVRRPSTARSARSADRGSPRARTSAIKDYAARAPSGRTDLRIERQRMIRALVLAGPDAQVM